MSNQIWESPDGRVSLWAGQGGVTAISVNGMEDDLDRSEAMDMADAVQYHYRTLGFSDKLLPHEVEFWAGFSKVHNPTQCEGQNCPLHNPTDHTMRDWPLHWRADRGIVERICAHGVGHPDPSQFQFWDESGDGWKSTHGCCGCH